MPTHQLKRGDLLEMEVELAVDPIFEMSTLISEFLGLAKSIPELVEIANIKQQLRDAGPVNSLLQHLLAGLIPLRSTAINYCVFQHNSGDYIVHKEALETIGIRGEPLEIVGVTEHLSYWKDIRRILFSSGRFTMLCRIARDGVQSTWTPVKLADLFDTVAPDFRKQIESIKEITPAQPQLQLPQPDAEQQFLERALTHFLNKYLALAEKVFTEREMEQTMLLINNLVSEADVKSVTGQNEAFRKLTTALDGTSKLLTPNQILELRKESRHFSAIEGYDKPNEPTIVAPQAKDNEKGEIIDTEVIAIYW